MRTCVATIAIGDEYYRHFAEVFMPSQQTYATRNGYEYRVVRSHAGDIRHRSTISLEKQLLCSQEWASSYDFLIYLDADVLAAPTAPALHVLCASTDRIGAVDEMSQPTRDARRSLQIRAGWERTVSEYYELCQITFDTEFVFNTGVLVFQPRKHAEFCRNIYNAYKHNQLIHPRGFHYEQAAVNYEYQKNDKLIPIPSEWNSLWNIHKFAGYEGTLTDFMKEKHFAHLAGGFDHQAARAWTSGRIW